MKLNIFKAKYDKGFFDGLEQALWFLEDEVDYSSLAGYDGDVIENHMDHLNSYIEYLREENNYGDTRDEAGRDPYECEMCDELGIS